MKIATWNVNSVRVRLERLLAWFQKIETSVVLADERWWARTSGP